MTNYHVEGESEVVKRLRDTIEYQQMRAKFESGEITVGTYTHWLTQKLETV
jgi:hypothetical protein